MKTLDLDITYYKIIVDGDVIDHKYDTREEAQAAADNASWQTASVKVAAYNKFDKIIERGWFWPSGARKCHFDRGDGYALCGKWMRIGIFGAAPIQADEHAKPSNDDCVVCRRKLEDGK